MKYFLSVFAILAFVGAGCVQGNTTVETTIETPTETDSTETPEEGSTDSDLGIEVTTVPITEVVLGEETNVQVAMEADNFSFTPNVITAAPGDEIEITFTKNTGFHTFVIDEINLSFAIAQGENLIFTAPNEPGEYAFYCDIGSHRSMGMEGTLIVK